MEIKNSADIINTISKERLSSYKFNSNDDIETMLKRYLFNVQVSECFYPLISALEIALRNNLFNAVANLKGSNWLINEIASANVLSQNERNILLEAIKKLNNKHSSISNGSIIAELTLGFWINLCKKSYKNSLWDKKGFFESVFPDFYNYFKTTALDKTKVIFPLLKDILRLRNRIFHHEIIINNKNGISNCYNIAYKVLYSLSKDYAQMFEPTFRFKEIIKQKP